MILSRGCFAPGNFDHQRRLWATEACAFLFTQCRSSATERCRYSTTEMIEPSRSLVTIFVREGASSIDCKIFPSAVVVTL